MNDINNEKNKSSVILNPERSEWVSRSHVTSVEIVVNDGAKTKRYSVKRDLYGDFAYAQPLKMTEKALSFLSRCGASDIVGIRNVITRRTSVRRGYLPEQGTHANKESLFSCVTWLMRLPRRIQRMLLVMTIPMLALIFTLITTAESSATDKFPTSGTCNSVGTCLWTLDSAGTLTISAKDGEKDVKMANYNCQYNPCEQSSLVARPWEANLQQIKSIVIGDNITQIGNDAFQNASNLKSVTGMKDVQAIGDKGVFAYTGLTEFTIPDGVTYLGYSAFTYSNLTNLTLPDSINKIGTKKSGVNPFSLSNSLTEINCLNTSGQCENLHELIKGLITNKAFNIISPTSNCASYNSRGCTACENTFYLSDGMCWNAWEKKRWTPAEANQWLHDGNDNFVVLTFKK